jgi:hypothetical protein
MTVNSVISLLLIIMEEYSLYVDRSQWPHGRQAWGLGPLVCWDCAFEFRGGCVCTSLLSVVCCQMSLHRADHSSRGILPSVVCPSVNTKPR